MHKQKHYEMDMTNGPLLGKIIRFALPLMFTGILQLLYNAADVVVVGRWAGATALAAVSSTGSLTGLIVNFFMGFSLGASVLVAQAYGAGDHKQISDAVHTSLVVAIICGALVSLLGILFGRPLLELMDSPADVIDQSTLYITIIFAGSLFNLVFNFGASILRAVGDTKRPMYYLILSGLVNVVLNLIFVIGFHMGVAGVALATVASQIMSCVLVIICLLRSHTAIRLDVRKLRLNRQMAMKVLKIGLPAGLQSMMFSISNMLIQSSVNSFGSDVMAGNGAAANIEAFVYTAMNAFYTACLTFTSQNVGARKPERIGRIMLLCQLCVAAVGLGMGIGVTFFSEHLIGIYTTDPHVIQMGMLRTSIIALPYFLCGMMDTFVGGLRGMGNSLVPMIISIVGVCVFRVGWVVTIFAANRTLETLYFSYPVSWFMTGAAHCACFLLVKRRLTKRIHAEMSL